MKDNVDHPKHYNDHPSGVECIQITEHMGFNLGNAVKYIWRADLKGNTIEDLKKAAWYIGREIEKIEKDNDLCRKVDNDVRDKCSQLKSEIDYNLLSDVYPPHISS